MRRAFNFSLIALRGAKRCFGSLKGKDPLLTRSGNRAGVCGSHPPSHPAAPPSELLTEQSSSQQGSAASALQA